MSVDINCARLSTSWRIDQHGHLRNAARLRLDRFKFFIDTDPDRID
ncbi:hypothetical protein [Janthinobacterium agaricidamnosum]|nr:hypothetical protein [Janthinobacterium agaricidamnosum]